MFGLSALLALSGCSTTHDAAWQEPRPLGETIPSYRPPIEVPADTLAYGAPAVTDTLTLRKALALSLQFNPTLQAFGWEVRAREAHGLQAGLVPNPEIGFEAENFGGTDDLNGFDSAELTLEISQLLELGGDRRRRRDVAHLERDLAGWDYETVRLDVLTETKQAFVGVLAAQERLNLSDTLLSIAGEFHRTAAARVEAGKSSVIEHRRAQIVLSTAEIAYYQASQELSVARAQLSAAWGRSEPTFGVAVGALKTVTSIPPYEALEVFVQRNPDVARWRDEMALRHSDVALEKAVGIPNPTLRFGPRRLRGTAQSALVAGITIPLPIFNRNQGEVNEAKYRLEQGAALQRATETFARQVLAETYGRLVAAHNAAEKLITEVVPAADQNFQATYQGYQAGKFDILMVLDAQRTLFETTNQYIDALLDYHRTKADVERLVATPISILAIR
ncbi:MAG: TolC family protein [Rhodothermia bacterium]